jgi:branched-chain amino acid transport system permease protein
VEDLIVYIVRGLPAGCVYGLVAMAIVLTYKTSGVFNLAFGAQAFVSAAVFYKLLKEHDWPTWAAGVVAIVVVAPLLGLLLDYLIFRHMRTQPLIVKLVAALGLLTALPELTKLWFGKEQKLGPPSIAPDPDHVNYPAKWFGIDSTRVNITNDRLTSVIATVVVVLVLGAIFRYTALGLRMRAVVESPRMVELAGVNATAVSRIAWALSGFLAGLAGVLLGHTNPSLQANDFTVLMVVSIAAAAFGALKSIPMTLAGGMVISILGEQAIPGWFGITSSVTEFVRPTFPFLMLFLLLVFDPRLRIRREATDPMAGVDPPPPNLAASYRDARVEKFTRFVLTPVFITTVLLLVYFGLSGLWVATITGGVCYAIIFLSITMITGLSGQLSLAQSVFAGAGGFTVAQTASKLDWNPFFGLLLGVAIAAAAGALLAIPVMRLGGLYLAIATLALALLAQRYVYTREWVGGTGGVALTIPRPTLFGLDFTNDKAFFTLAAVVLVVSAYVVVAVRGGTTGRFLSALRGSETAASASAIDPVKYKVLVFALSAAIAGAGGAMIALSDRSASTGIDAPSPFSPFFGLVYVVLVVTLGVRTIEGAINAGMSFVLFPELLHAVHIPIEFALIGWGFGAITFARHPEGIVEAQKRASILRVNENNWLRVHNPALLGRRFLKRSIIFVLLGCWPIIFAFTRDAGSTRASLGITAVEVDCGSVWDATWGSDPGLGLDGATLDQVKSDCRDNAQSRFTQHRGKVWDTLPAIWDWGGLWKAFIPFWLIAIQFIVRGLVMIRRAPDDADLGETVGIPPPDLVGVGSAAMTASAVGPNGPVPAPAAPASDRPVRPGARTDLGGGTS